MQFLNFQTGQLSRRSALAVLVTLAFISVFTLMVMRGSEKQTKPTEKTWNVNVRQAERGTHQPVLVLQGTSESPRTAMLKAAIVADVVAVEVLEGNFVSKNQVLVRLDDRDAKLLVAQRKAEVDDLQAQITQEFNRVRSDRAAYQREKDLLALNKKDLQRQRNLLKKRVVSQSELDNQVKLVRQQEIVLTNRENALSNHQARLKQIQARLERARALLAQAKLDLVRTVIRAPFAGRITSVAVTAGNRVSIGETLIAMFDSNAVEVRAQIPAKYVATIQDALAQQKSLLATAKVDGTQMQLRLDRLAGEVRQGGGVDALFRVEQRERPIPLGRSMPIVLKLPKLNNVFSIEPTAIYGADRIYIVRDQRMLAIRIQRLGITAGAAGKNRVLFDSDAVQTGDLIITTQLPNARTGLKVTIRAEP